MPSFIGTEPLPGSLLDQRPSIVAAPRLRNVLTQEALLVRLESQYENYGEEYYNRCYQKNRPATFRGFLKLMASKFNLNLILDVTQIGPLWISHLTLGPFNADSSAHSEEESVDNAAVLLLYNMLIRFQGCTAGPYFIWLNGNSPNPNGNMLPPRATKHFIFRPSQQQPRMRNDNREAFVLPVSMDLNYSLLPNYRYMDYLFPNPPMPEVKDKRDLEAEDYVVQCMFCAIVPSIVAGVKALWQ